MAVTYSELCDLIIDEDDADSSLQTSYLRSIIIRLKQEANKHLDLGAITVDSPVYYSMEEFVEMIERNEMIHAAFTSRNP